MFEIPNKCVTNEECGCGGDTVCHFESGLFDCVCEEEGFEKVNSTHCVDIDECETGRHSCDDDTVCLNKMGSFQCLKET